MLLHTLQSEFADHLTSHEQTLEGVLPLKHLQIYQHKRITHLIHALHHTYPLIYKLVGATIFRDIAENYIVQYPSCSSNLLDYGAYLNTFIETHADVKHLTFISELATFEWSCHQVYYAADSDAQDLQTFNYLIPNDHPHLQFTLHPASIVQSFQYPIMQIISLCKGEAHDIDLNTGNYYLQIIRRELEISLIALDPADFAFLYALQNNLPLHAAIHAALHVDPAFQVDEKLPAWFENKTIVGWTTGEG